MKQTFLVKFLFLPFLCLTLPHRSMAQSATWHQLEAKGEAEERSENALVKAGDKIILLGGRGVNGIDIYDTQQKEWSRGALPPIEFHHAQVVSLNGLVYVVGAFTGSFPYETPISHIMIYDPLLDTWAIGPEMPADRRRGAAGVAIYNDKIYVVNGIINGHTSGWVQWLDEFDPATNKWSRLPDAPRARDHANVVVINDKLYVAGGRLSGFNGETFANTVKETNVFDFNTREWTELPSPEGDIPTARAGTAAAIYQDKLLVIGGESGEQELAHNEVEMLDVASGRWGSLSPLLRGRHGAQAVSFDDMVVIGAGSGNRGGGPKLNSFEILGPTENPEIPASPLTKGEISASMDTIVFNLLKEERTKTIEITNKGGNQALFLSYVILDNPKDFEIRLPVDEPFALAPGQILPIEVRWKGEADHNPVALLLIKTLGPSAPVSIPVVLKR